MTARVAARPRGQRGQGLTELALVAPLFALLLLLFGAWARLAVTRLALVQLSRDATLMLARNGDLWNSPLSAQQAAVRRLAQDRGLLEAESLRLDFEDLAPLALDQVEALRPALNGPLGAPLRRLAGLRRYRLRYRLSRRGFLGALSRNLELEERLVVHGDPWKMDPAQIVERMLR